MHLPARGHWTKAGEWISITSHARARPCEWKHPVISWTELPGTGWMKRRLLKIAIVLRSPFSRTTVEATGFTLRHKLLFKGVNWVHSFGGYQLWNIQCSTLKRGGNILCSVHIVIASTLKHHLKNKINGKWRYFLWQIQEKKRKPAWGSIKEDTEKITQGEVTSVHPRGDFTWIDLKFFIPGVKTLDSLSSNISRP